jgi:alkylation response protein AidB-like acyl-CoA dehydrogenase
VAGVGTSRRELAPQTEAGGRFAELAAMHASVAAERAPGHDAQGSFPIQTIEEMRASGFLGGLIPSALGGVGVETVHDWAVGMNRLGRGDGSTGIAVNMHLGATFGMVRLRDAMVRTDNRDVVAFFDRLLERRVRDEIVCAPLTERGTTLNHPQLAATRLPDGRWSLSGRKVFGTLSPAADLFSVTAVVDEGGAKTTAIATIRQGTPGMAVLDNWDALGMRASGSNDIVFEECVVPANAVVLTHPWGTMPETVMVTVIAQVSGLLGVFLGIAEAARDEAYSLVTSRTKQPSGATLASHPGVQRHAARIEIDLAVCRSMLDRVTRLLDEYLAEHPAGQDDREAVTELFVEFQATKYMVNRNAIAVVDNAMTMTGGAGYLSSSVLARLYRDVRAGPFMQSYSPNEVVEFIGPTSLGLPPQGDL